MDQRIKTNNPSWDSISFTLAKTDKISDLQVFLPREHRWSDYRFTPIKEILNRLMIEFNISATNQMQTLLYQL
jgi:hypothetical protein